MSTPTVLSRYKLSTFAQCARRFQLQYLQELSWPTSPPPEAWRLAAEQGKQFHQRAEQLLHGMPVTAPPDAQQARWWEAFEAFVATLPAGKRLPEMALTVPIGEAGYSLTGRFDLLILTADTAHIFDWKTESRPRTENTLRDSLQTKLYFALLAEGSAALQAKGQPIAPENVHLTYWFANDPQATVRLTYDTTAHKTAWHELETQVAQITARDEDDVWPLTTNLTTCKQCPFNAYCGRQQTTPHAQEHGDGTPSPIPTEMPPEPLFPLEPELP